MLHWATARAKACRRSAFLSLATLLLVVAQPASADFVSLNIDYGTSSTPTPPGTPDDGYGAAAAQPGFWNGLVGGPLGAGPQALSDLNGVLTGVTIEMSPVRDELFFDNGATIGDDHQLLDDFLNLGDAADLTEVPTTFTFLGFSPGPYIVFTYAWAPDDPLFLTSVDVNGIGAQLVGGDWTGNHALGVTFARHEVDLLLGQNLVITASPADGFGSLNGIQITAVQVRPVPEPGTALLGGLGAGLLALTHARRRKRRSDTVVPA